MTSVINELFDHCPSCDRPLAMYQFYMEERLRNGADLMSLIDEIGITCMGCRMHIITKPMMPVMDYMRDSMVIINEKQTIRERGFVVEPNVPLPGQQLLSY